MNTYTNVFLHGKPKVEVSASGAVGLVIRIRPNELCGSELCIYVDDQACADLIADAIFHAKMDKDADAMQADEATTL